MKPRSHHLTALLFALTLGTAHANLIAHYKFDSTDGTTTPDSAPGSVAFATLNDLTITASDPKVGTGALEMSGTGDGATTSNTFAWSNDTRTISFWWKTKLVAPDPEDPENLIPADVTTGTYISMGGSGTTAGGRFDLRELNNPNTATLRLEVQGGGNLINTNPSIDDGEWHFITIVVPNETSTLGEVRAYVDGDTVNDLFTAFTSTTTINTITSALRFGHSVLGGRVPNGFIDDVQLYNVALDNVQIASLYQTPGSTISLGDEIPPTITTLSPPDNGVSLISSNLSATFSEAIVAGTGAITLFNASDDSVIESFDVATSPRINISGATLSIDPTNDLPGNVGIYVNIDAGAIRDSANNDFAGILDSFTWNFITDVTPPTVASINSPTSGAGSVGVANPLQLSFSETVVADTGTIVIRRVDDNSIVTTIDVTSAYVIINGFNVAIVPPGGLPGSTELYIEFGAGTFKDGVGNPYAGSSGSGLWSFTTAATSDLLAHYRFDIDESGTTPDSAGPAFATLGSRVNIDTTPEIPLAGAGALSMNGGGTNAGASQGAVSSNSFAWVDTQRTITFWWRTKLILNEFEELVPANTDQGTYFTSGTNAGSGTRFDVKEAVDATLRLELQGGGAGSSNPAIDDGEWHFIAIVVPENTTFADIQWFVDGDPTDLNPSDSASAVITGLGPIAFGDSIINVGNLNRVPNGYLDEAQVYRRALDQSELDFLYNNPGLTIYDAPPSGPQLIIIPNGSTYDFTWDSLTGSQYDLLSSTGLSTPISTWDIYNDGITTYENIPASGAGINTLTGVTPLGPVRFFALREEEVPAE